MEPRVDFLSEVTAARRADARARAEAGALGKARIAAETARPVRSFAGALRANGLSLIAEVKRASPSAGAIDPSADPIAQALGYERAGAAAVSVLTEPDHFNGSLEDLRVVASNVNVPVLRKDFIGEPLQVWEARAAGADAVLLIVAALERSELAALLSLTESLGMDGLVEVHGVDDVTHAVDAGARVIGINARNLATLEVDLDVIGSMRPLIPEGIVVVGESGVRSRADALVYERAGCDAILVGEALMRASDPSAAVRELLGR